MIEVVLFGGREAAAAVLGLAIQTKKVMDAKEKRLPTVPGTSHLLPEYYYDCIASAKDDATDSQLKVEPQIIDT